MVSLSLIGPPALTAARAVHFAYSTRIWQRGSRLSSLRRLLWVKLFRSLTIYRGSQARQSG